MGSTDLSETETIVRRGVSKVLIHPSWNRLTFDNDLALLKLDKKVEFSKTLKRLCLPQNKTESFIGELLMSIKW